MISMIIRIDAKKFNILTLLNLFYNLDSNMCLSVKQIYFSMKINLYL